MAFEQYAVSWRAGILAGCLAFCAACGSDDSQSQGWQFDASGDDSDVQSSSDAGDDVPTSDDGSTDPDVTDPEPDATDEPDAADPPEADYCIERSDNPATDSYRRTDFDDNGQPVRIRTRDGGLSTDERLTYDEAGRLAKKRLVVSGGESRDWTVRVGEYGYDSRGNRTRTETNWLDAPGGDYVRRELETRAYDAENRLVLREIDEGRDGTIDSRDEYEWSVEGDRDIRRKYDLVDGQRTIVEQYVYYRDGRIDEYFIDNAAFGGRQVIEYVYDQQGRIVEKQRTHDDGRTEIFAQFQWSDASRLSRVRVFEPSLDATAEASVEHGDNGYVRRMRIGIAREDSETRAFSTLFEGLCEVTPTDVQAELFSLATFVR
jgi:YD repeat-containing protein